MKSRSLKNILIFILKSIPFILVIFVGIFLINHTISDQQITVSNNVVLDFNQCFGESSMTSYWNGITYTNNNSNFTCTGTSNVTSNGAFRFTSYEFIDGHSYYFNCSDTSLVSSLILYTSSNYSLVARDSVFIADASYVSYQLLLHATASTTYDVSGYITLIDLTQLFSNTTYSPTLSNFNLFYSNLGQFNYIESDIQLKEVTTVTKDNSDFLSQAIYTIYNTIEDNFNFNQFLNFNDFYEWQETTFFNGNAPVIWFIVWNILLYEFMIDLLLLFYSFMTFIIKIAQKWTEDFYNG